MAAEGHGDGHGHTHSNGAGGCCGHGAGHGESSGRGHGSGHGDGHGESSGHGPDTTELPHSPLAILHKCSSAGACIAFHSASELGCFHFLSGSSIHAKRHPTQVSQPPRDICFHSHEPNSCEARGCVEKQPHIHGHAAVANCQEGKPPQKGEDLIVLRCSGCKQPGTSYSRQKFVPSSMRRLLFPMAVADNVVPGCESKDQVLVDISAKPVSTQMIVEGICCPSEVPIIDNILKKLPGVTKVSTNVTAKTTTVEHNPVLTSPEELVHHLNQASLSARLKRGSGEEQHSKLPSPILMVTGLLWVVSMVSLADHDEETWVHYLKFVALGGVAFGLPRILMKAFGALRNRILDINCLMVIAAIGAIAIGDYTEACAVVFLFGLSEWLEEMATAKARNALASVLSLRPEEATMVGTGKTVKVDDVVVGDRLAVRAGDKVPVDGVVVEGVTSLDQSALTGESVPVKKEKGDRVSAGTVNVGGGYLEIEATAVAGDSAVAKMVKLIEEANSHRSKTELLVDKFAKIYTPVVIGLAFLLGSVPWIVYAIDPETVNKEKVLELLYMALVLLVVSCPCALVISTPVTYVSTLTTAATHNIIIRGGEYLEALGRIKTICLDKTGTLTEGRFVVREVVGTAASGSPELQESLSLMAAVEGKSTHPLATALLAYAREQGVEMSLQMEDFQVTDGEGVAASVQGRKVQVGSRRLARKMGWVGEGAKGETQQTPVPGLVEHKAEEERQIQEMEAKAYTVCYLGVDGKLAAILGISDAPRREAPEAVKDLQKLGVEQVMITGDQNCSAIAIGEQVGITTIKSECLPQDKVDIVMELKSKGRVAMVGDGINDAAALAAADVGIAMGATGTQVAMENAHVALMDSDLRKLVISIRLGRYAIAKIKQNVAFAVFSKVVMVALTMAGYASLWGAIVADLGAMLIVTLNASMVLNQRKQASGHGHDQGCCGNLWQAIKDDWNGKSADGCCSGNGGGHGHAHGGGGGGCCSGKSGGPSDGGGSGGHGGGHGHAHGHGGGGCCGH